MRDNRNSDDPFGCRAPGSNGTNGARPQGMRTRPISYGPRSAGGDERSEPVDLVAVQADDELINALAAGMAVSAPGVHGYDADDHVAAILAAWKADVDSEPIPELVDVDTAVATVLAARPRPGRARHLAPLAAAAAVIVLAVGGLSVGSYSAQPDDALWAVSKVLYSERAESVEAAARVESHITAAKQALVSGQPVRAAQELQEAEDDLAVVRPEEGQTELVEVQDFLIAKAAETPEGVAVDPGTPLATQPARPVPPGAEVPAEQQPAPGPATPGAPVTPAPGPTSGPDAGTPSEAPVSPAPTATSPAPTTSADGSPPPVTEGGSSATAEGGATTSMGQTPSGSGTASSTGPTS